MHNTTFSTESTRHIVSLFIARPAGLWRMTVCQSFELRLDLLVAWSIASTLCNAIVSTFQDNVSDDLLQRISKIYTIVDELTQWLDAFASNSLVMKVSSVNVPLHLRKKQLNKLRCSSTFPLNIFVSVAKSTYRSIIKWNKVPGRGLWLIYVIR